MELIKSEWSQSDYDNYIGYLKSVADEKYKKFNSSLVPGCETILGIRIPQVRKIAKEISKGDYTSFLKCNLHGYNEEKIIIGLVMAEKKCKYIELISDIRYFITLIDNWAVNDTVKFKMIRKYKKELLNDIDEFLSGENPWSQRYGLKMLMDFYLDDDNIEFVLEHTGRIQSDFYYVQMMQAWLVATSAVRYKDKVFELLKSNRLNSVTQNMAVRKIRESLRIEKSDKDKASEYIRKN